MMKKLKEIISNVLEIDAKVINNETSPENVSSWDSYNGLLLVSELENFFKVKFTMEEVLKLKNVKDIIEFLQKHGVRLNE